jgi:hypothetical protein
MIHETFGLIWNFLLLGLFGISIRNGNKTEFRGSEEGSNLSRKAVP